MAFTVEQVRDGYVVGKDGLIVEIEPILTIQNVTEKTGGYGANRELAELVLDLRGIDEITLPPA